MSESTRVRKTSQSFKHCLMDSFCNLESFCMGNFYKKFNFFPRTRWKISGLWKVFGHSGKFTDTMECFRNLLKVFGTLECSRNLWKVSGHFGKFCCCLESCCASKSAIWKVFAFSISSVNQLESTAFWVSSPGMLNKHDKVTKSSLSSFQSQHRVFRTKDDLCFSNCPVLTAGLGCCCNIQSTWLTYKLSPNITALCSVPCPIL